MLLNPSVIADQRPWIDIHLIGVRGFYASNFIYAENAILTDPNSLTTRAYNESRNRNWVQGNGLVLGPSASMTIKRSAIGFHTAARLDANANRVPPEFIKLLGGEPLGDEVTSIQVTNARVKGIGWAEAGASFATILSHFDDNLWTGGITVKRYFGLSHVGFVFNDAGFTLSDTGNSFISVDARAAFGGLGWNVGGGWGGSIGFTYKKMWDDVTHYIPHGRAERCLTIPYRYKLSVALTDIGYIRFSKSPQYAQITETAEAEALFDDADLTGITTESPFDLEERTYTTTPPMALSAQFDYNYSRGVFFNAFFTQRLSIGSRMWTERASVIAVSPRFERKLLTIGVPVSLVNYSRPQVGAFLRIWWLSVGTENIIPFVVRSDIYSADVYFHLRILFNKSNKCKTTNNSPGERFRFRDIFNRSDPRVLDCPKW